jgi:hypothetical protein
VNRATALAHLQGQFTALATMTGQDTDDSAAGYGPALDAALRQLGYAAGDLATADVPDATTPDYLQLAEYFALVRFSRALAGAVDIELDGPRIVKRRSQTFTQVAALIAETRAQLQAKGYLSGGFEFGRITLDFLEPSASV